MTIPREDRVRTCSECGLVKPLVDFWKKTAKEINGSQDVEKHYHRRCRACYNKYHVGWRAKEGNKYREKMRERYRSAVRELPENKLAEFRKHHADRKKRQTVKLKDRVYLAYGGYMCACCGETEPAFLTLDHINDDGWHMRKNVHGSNGTAVLSWAVKNNFPPTLQVLCWNCQWGKRKNGICPHTGNP